MSLLTETQVQYFFEFSTSPLGVKIKSRIIELANDFTVGWQKDPELDDAMRGFFSQKNRDQIGLSFVELDNNFNLKEASGFWLLGLTMTMIPTRIPPEIVSKIFSSLSIDELNDITELIKNIPKGV